MDATDIETFVDALIDELTPAPAPDDGGGGRRLWHLLDGPRGVVDDPALLAVLAAAVTARNVFDHVIAQAVAATERAGIPARKHLRSGADLLTPLGMSPGATWRAIRVGRAAHTLPALTAQQRLGAIGIDIADAIGKGIAHIDARVPFTAQERAEAVTTLMIQPTPTEVAKKARTIALARTTTAPDGDDGVVPVAENTDLNDMTLMVNDEGRVTATLDLDALTGEELWAALDPLCRPVPLPDGSADPRPVGRRRADAFGQLLRTYLSGSDRPMSGGVLPHVTLTRPAHGGGGGRGGVDCLGFGGPISTHTADMIACDSTLTSVIVDAAGAPLDVGRAERLFTPAIRKALAVRDRGCAYPGCGRPVSWCDAHHITPWEHGGHTSLDNGVLLCRHHHTAIHHRGWQVYLGPDRHPWFIPPHNPTGPPPTHLRSHAQRTMTTQPVAA